MLYKKINGNRTDKTFFTHFTIFNNSKIVNPILKIERFKIIIRLLYSSCKEIL